MDRRSFFKIVGTASGGLMNGACGKQAREILPLLVPEEEILPGEERWHPGVCTECAAGCGTILRVMKAERVIVKDNERFRQQIAAVKKIEGNPLDPVSGGRLCARGQAAVQALYHPDRLRGPMRRAGERGAASFEPVSWEQAMEQAAVYFQKTDPSRIIFLGKPQAGTRSYAVASFLKALGAPPASTLGICDFTVERKAAEIAFGWRGLPVYEIQNADFVLSVGADFLGGWVSPVFYSRRYGHMRQGRPGRRGRLIHAESRFSLTAGSADRWLPVRPGGEHAFALAIGHVLVTEKLARADGWSPAGLLEAFASVDFERAVAGSGLTEEQVRETVRELGRWKAPVVVAGASVVQTNSLDAVVAANALNWLVGSVGREGGVMPPPVDPTKAYEDTRPQFSRLRKRLETAELVALHGTDPVYTLPFARKALERTPTVISFSSFIDDSTAYADLVLPDHAPLESAAVFLPAAAPGPSLAGTRAFVRPLHETRATDEILAEIAERLDRPIGIDTPRRAFEKVSAEEGFAAFCERQGGWWSERGGLAAATPLASVPPLRAPEFDGDPEKYPLYFQPYPSVQFGDGSGAHLPWMQELPDPVSSAMWGLPVEVDPKTAAYLGIRNGDEVRVMSSSGQVEAPVYVNPAALPGVVSMAIGQGHAHYGRYAAGRGANPLSIIADAADRDTGVPAFGATRIRLIKTGRRGRNVQFSTMDREPHIGRRR